MNNFLFPFDSKVTYEQRKLLFMQEPRLIWLTGLSGSGKTTLALRLENYLFNKGYKVFILDGDNIRKGLNKDLGFTEQDRKENLRRIGEVAKLMMDAGLIIISAFISPYEQDRMFIKNIVDDRFIEVHVNCPVGVCEQRDIKGLYAKARKGIIPDFTGVSAPYEIPLSPDVEVNTNEETIEESLDKIINFVESQIRIGNE
ncbi:MAG: adenylyl-sulfate kinase [Chitinophagaceae bacterium]